MGELKKYQDILVNYLTDFANRSRLANIPEVENRIIVDRDNNSFQMLRIGWHNEHFIFAMVFHFDIREGKVWFQCNNTELEVVDELMKMGIPKEDIVLGFQPPYARPYTGFATA